MEGRALVVDNGPDEQLGAMLQTALQAQLSSDDVDVRSLLRGSRRRSRRVRTQRLSLLAAAAVLVVAVPAGYEVIAPSSGKSAQSQSAALLPSSSAAGHDEGDKPSAASTNPDYMAFTSEELPNGLTLYWASGMSNGSATVNGQDCQHVDPTGERPIEGRQWLWTTNTGQLSDLGVTLTVTHWSAGTAAEALSELADDTGYCHWSDPQVERSSKVKQADGTWASTSSSHGLHYARTVIRVGDVIAGVEVQNPKGVKDAAVLADDLARIEASRLRT
jgi:hypothetical protein